MTIGSMPEQQISSSGDDLVDPLPALERVVAERPNDAKALVALANHYWLIGAGPEVVGDLASRAIAADPDNRAGWHLWALAESNPRERVARWQQVSTRFPKDLLAKANLADNAAALAGAEHDYQAVDLAIDTYEQLLSVSDHPYTLRASRANNNGARESLATRHAAYEDTPRLPHRSVTAHAFSPSPIAERQLEHGKAERSSARSRALGQVTRHLRRSVPLQLRSRWEGGEGSS